jgi:hypothetical protein
MTASLEDIELFAGNYWFTDGKTTIQGPFKTKHEAQQAKKEHEEKPKEVLS